MDVLELPRPVINFLRTMSKEMHRYALCWDIYGGNEAVTLTLTWKLKHDTSTQEENQQIELTDDETETRARAKTSDAYVDGLVNKRQVSNDRNSCLRFKSQPHSQIKQYQHSKLETFGKQTSKTSSSNNSKSNDNYYALNPKSQAWNYRNLSAESQTRNQFLNNFEQETLLKANHKSRKLVNNSTNANLECSAKYCPNCPSSQSANKKGILSNKSSNNREKSLETTDNSNNNNKISIKEPGLASGPIRHQSELDHINLTESPENNPWIKRGETDKNKINNNALPNSADASSSCNIPSSATIKTVNSANNSSHTNTPVANKTSNSNKHGETKVKFDKSLEYI